MVNALVCITNLQTHIVTCCIHLRIHLMLRIPFPFLSFYDFVVYAVMAQIFSTNRSQCASFSKSVVTLFLSFKRVTAAHSLLIDSHHYKRHKKKNSDRIPPFHPHNHSVKSIILKNLKLLQNDPKAGTIFSQLPLISFKRDKNISNFLVRSLFQTNDQPGTFKCTRARCKTCPFIHNANKISGTKRSIKITDHFTFTSANVIYCITCTYCKKISREN